MNQEIARTLLLIFLLAVGGYQIAVGLRKIRRERENSFWGYCHSFVGFLLLILPVLLYFWLGVFQGE